MKFIVPVHIFWQYVFLSFLLKDKMEKQKNYMIIISNLLWGISYWKLVASNYSKF